MDTDIFIVYIKAENIYVDIAKDVETKFDTVNYELERPWRKEKNKKVIKLTKDELGGKIMKELAASIAKANSCLTNDSDEVKKSKVTRKVCHKTKS